MLQKARSRPQTRPVCCASPTAVKALGCAQACLRSALLLQDGEDMEDTERRRLSSAGLRGDEQPLPPQMVSFIVDALQDR